MYAPLHTNTGKVIQCTAYQHVGLYNILHFKLLIILVPKLYHIQQCELNDKHQCELYTILDCDSQCKVYTAH